MSTYDAAQAAYYGDDPEAAAKLTEEDAEALRQTHEEIKQQRANLCAALAATPETVDVMDALRIVCGWNYELEHRIERIAAKVRG